VLLDAGAQVPGHHDDVGLGGLVRAPADLGGDGARVVGLDAAGARTTR
jgi:hypothetical protein